MYDQQKFIDILKKCQGQLSLNEFARLANVDAGYLSRIINKKKTNPPSPNILKKISIVSNNIVSYEELMEICGYFTGKVNNSLLSSSYYAPIPIFDNIDDFYEYEEFLSEGLSENELIDCANHIYLKIKSSDNRFNYFAFKSQDDSMLPLLGIGDIAILEKTDTYKNGNTCLISLDDELILIRKIIEFNDYIELHTAFPYSQPIKITNEEKEKRNFRVLGKVIKAENQSAFK